MLWRSLNYINGFMFIILSVYRFNILSKNSVISFFSFDSSEDGALNLRYSIQLKLLHRYFKSFLLRGKLNFNFFRFYLFSKGYIISLNSPYSNYFDSRQLAKPRLKLSRFFQQDVKMCLILIITSWLYLLLIRILSTFSQLNYLVRGCNPPNSSPI